MQENPERSGTERNGTEPEVVINVSSYTTNYAHVYEHNYIHNHVYQLAVAQWQFAINLSVKG